MKVNTKEQNQEIAIYKSKDGQISFNVNVFEETVWITQKQMVELFDTDKSGISRHIKNIFVEGELDKNSVVAKIATTAPDGKLYQTEHYNLDMIVSVGYRVKSKRGIQFRLWANQILKQYLINGYAINEYRIKAIEDKLNILMDQRSEYKAEIKEIHTILLKVANRPITINNQISIASHKLEERIIELLDEIIGQIKTDKKLGNQLEQTKQNIKISPKDQKTKNQIVKFFKNVGDNNSDLHKTIRGAKITKRVIEELIKLGDKLKDLIL